MTFTSIKNNASATYMLLSAFVLLFFLSSCSAPRNIQYFQNISDTTKLTSIKTSAFVSPAIQPDDILSITVLTTDPLATQSINAANLPIQTTGVFVQQNAADQAVTGYLVDKEGDVQIPVLGKIHLAGLTIIEARDLLTKKASVFLNNPTVIVRNKNFKITVLGEVAKPATYILPNERVTVLDALGLAGDLTVYGKRENVLLLRKQDGGITNSIRINLNRTDLFNSPYYYLQQNDVIYVEPSEQRVAAANVTFTRNIGVATSILTTIVLLFQVFKK